MKLFQAFWEFFPKLSQTLRKPATMVEMKDEDRVHLLSVMYVLNPCKTPERLSI